MENNNKSIISSTLENIKKRTEQRAMLDLKINAIRLLLQRNQERQLVVHSSMNADFEKSVDETYATFFWPYLPDAVTGIDFGKGRVYRTTELSRVDQLTWTLVEIEDYGKYLAKQRGLRWVPVLQTSSDDR